MEPSEIRAYKLLFPGFRCAYTQVTIKIMTIKSIYIIYTGGTIGMQNTEQGYKPMPGFFAKQMASMSIFQHPEMPSYAVKEYSPLIDSSNMTPRLWVQIAHDIVDEYDNYDGFIVLHGTDTMAYTASALSFMLENLQKPIIFTGSQVPLVEIRNDAHDNLVNALLIASHYQIPEVSLYFNHKLFRGNRARKLHTHSYAAFASPNFPPLARVGTDIVLNAKEILQPNMKRLQLNEIKHHSLACLRLFPGMSNAILENILQPPLKALVLETYGLGNAPDQDQQFLAILKRAIDNGILIANCSQCVHGQVSMSHYATGWALQEAGLISAGDMTPEAALTKLYYLFSLDIPLDEIKHQFRSNLRGEMTSV